MKLRFKDENGNNYPDWENKRLDTLANFKGGGTPSTTNENYWSGTIPWLSSSDLNQSNFVYKISKKISSDAIENSSTNLIPPGSILLVNRVGLGKLAITKSHLCTSQDFLNLVNIKINTVYLGYALKLKANFEALQVQGTSIKGIPSSVIKKWEICIPKSIGEQEKIGSFFKLQDEVIELKEELIKEKREYKKGLLQKVFNQELRFKDENGNNYPDWEEKKLGEISRITMGVSPLSESYTLDSSNYPLLQGNADLVKGYSVATKFTTKITKVSRKGELLFSLRAPVGFAGINTYNEAVIGRGLASISSDRNNYIKALLEKLENVDYWNNISQGSTFKAVSKDDLRKLSSNMPQSLEEQEKIGNLFKSIDEEIELLENEVIQLKQQKKYYLSVMM